MAKEVDRIENWTDGEVRCGRCGRLFTLYFNGGELDRRECCGRIYQTEHVKVDLVIYEGDPEDEDDDAPADTTRAKGER